MTAPQHVVVISRSAGPAEGLTTVRAEITNGVNGEYVIASHLVGTPGEIEEILAQSAQRMEHIDIHRHGRTQ